MSDDQRLLKEYLEKGSRNALQELIQRYLVLVHSSALRQVRDPNLAEDVTQAAFLVLTQKARTIRDGVAIGGWLLSVTRCVVATVMRKQTIKKKHEQLAARPEVLEAAADDWEEIAPRLDVELNRLGQVDRDAVVLRFFQDRSFAEIGMELGLSENAARKRVGRALERLRARLARRCMSPNLTTGTLGVAIGAFAMQAAPNHLSAATIAASVGSATPHCVSIAKGAIEIIAWTKAKLVGMVAATFLMGSTGAAVTVHAIARQMEARSAISPQSPALAARSKSPLPPVLTAAAAPTALPAPAVPATRPTQAAPAIPAAPAGPQGQRGNETTV